MFIQAGIGSRNQGFMMVELAMAMVLMAIAISPMIAALSPSIHVLSSQEDISLITTRAFGTLNRVAGLDYTTLESNMGSPASLSALLGSVPAAAEESFTLKGQAYTPMVTINDASSGIGGLLEVSVTLDNITLKTMRANF